MLAGGVAAAILIIVIVTSVLLVSGNNDDSTAGNTAQTPASTNPANPNDAQLLIRDLLDQRNWATTSNMDAFIEKWQALPADTRSSSMESLELNQLTTAIYKQLLKERALSGLGNEDDATNKQQQLIDFAEKIGINDPRIAMPE